MFKRRSSWNNSFIYSCLWHSRPQRPRNLEQDTCYLSSVIYSYTNFPYFLIFVTTITPEHQLEYTTRQERIFILARIESNDERERWFGEIFLLSHVFFFEVYPIVHLLTRTGCKIHCSETWTSFWTLSARKYDVSRFLYSFLTFLEYETSGNVLRGKILFLRKFRIDLGRCVEFLLSIQL